MTTSAADTAKCTCPTFDGEQAISIACPVHGYPGYPTSLDGKASAVEPGAIVQMDGVPCGCLFRTFEGAIRHGSETGELVDPDEPIRECDLHKALRERVAGLEGDLKHSEDKLWRSAGRNNNLAKELAAAEAREVEELTEAKRWEAMCASYQAEVAELEARVVELAEALERARAVSAEGYAAGLAMAAIVADQHRGAAAKARLAKGNPLGKMDDDGLVVEIRAEERGEDIAAEIIAKAIRALGKEEE